MDNSGRESIRGSTVLSNDGGAGQVHGLLGVTEETECLPQGFHYRNNGEYEGQAGGHTLETFKDQMLSHREKIKSMWRLQAWKRLNKMVAPYFS